MNVAVALMLVQNVALEVRFHSIFGGFASLYSFTLSLSSYIEQWYLIEVVQCVMLYNV